jgi:hypothetical protein
MSYGERTTALAGARDGGGATTERLSLGVAARICRC